MPERAVPEAAIEAAGLGKRYWISAPAPPARGLGSRAARRQPFWALRDVGFSLAPGERVGVVGCNGSGKSTLLKILARITFPSEGRARIRGRVASLLEVGTGFHPELSGRENVLLNGVLLGMKRHEVRARFDEIVAFAGVEGFIDTPVKHYSSGMRVRLAFAVAAHLEPEILLVDEVLAVGDAAFQSRSLGKMDEVTRDGRSVLFVSHNMAAVQRLCSRVLVLSQGRLVADDTPEAGVARYLELSAAPEEAPVALAALRRTREEWGTQVRISGCRVLGVDGRRAHMLRFGEEVRVRVDLEADGAQKDLAILIGIDALDETRIATAVSRESGRVFDAAPDAPLSLEAAFPHLTLRPGIHRITVGVLQGLRTLDHLAGAARFTVSEVCAQGVAPTVVTVGHLRAEAAWRPVEPS
jgi:lipopolysaccharide transport system ATP-binding protein